MKVIDIEQRSGRKEPVGRGVMAYCETCKTEIWLYKFNHELGWRFCPDTIVWLNQHEYAHGQIKFIYKSK